ncbi:MAG: glycosyltransferase family 4 protein [Chlamydiae bacterium]|nr:glycosyltransferase family 4 protein [Chlamydiota bacterium]
MKIVFLKRHLNQGGGLEKYAMRIANAFIQRGNDVTFLTSKSSVKTPHFILPTPRYLPGFLQIALFDRKVNSWISQNKVDLIFGLDRNRNQTHFRAGNGVHAAYLKSRIKAEGTLKYALCKINPLHRTILQIEKEAFESPTLQKIFVNSHMVQKEILEYYRVDPKKIEVIHNGVEWKEHEPFFEARKHSDQFRLLFVGNGYKRKGLDILLEALSNWQFKDFHLSVVGKEKNLNRYQWKVKKLSLEKKVSFFGVQKDVIPFYQLADILVIPSFYDPFANVTLEALSFGLFVISSKTNGGHEILTKENGTVLENIDKETMVNALNVSLQHRKTFERAKMIRNSVSHLDFSTQLSKLIDACNV